MLRSVSFHNFIHFTKPQTLTFDDGSNFIIGGNSCGKTAVLELIRRCCSNKLNSTFSSFDTKNGKAYTLCHYSINKDSKFPGYGHQNLSDLLAGIFVIPVEGEKNNYKYYKLLVVINQDTSVENVFIYCYSGYSKVSIQSLKSADLFYQERNNIDEEFSKIDTKVAFTSTVLEKTVNQVLSLIMNSVKENDKEVESRAHSIYEWLDGKFVAILPSRSIGPLQWSKSQFIQNENNDNYEKASRRAEILLDLLKLRNKKENNLFDFPRYKLFHDGIVHPYRFEIESGNQVVFYNEENVGKDSMPILKCPEGIVEAEQLALILSTNEFQTITIEEPERGMHPHMVGKLRDWLLKKIKDKTVIVITHNPVMMDHVTINSTFICSKNVNNGVLSHSIRKYPNDFRKYGREDEMKILLFSERVLFVEGFTDKIIVEKILSEKFDELVHHIDNDEQSSIEFTRYLSTIHVIELEGKDKGQKKKEFCEKLEKEHLFLYDFDKLNGSPIKANPEDLRANTTKLKEFESKCESENMFIWLDGSLEKVINTCAKRLDFNVKKRLKLPMEERRDFNDWKKSLVDKDDKDISHLAKIMIDHADEVKRFMGFLQTMKSKDGNEATIDGRPNLQQAKRKLDLESTSGLGKRPKSDEQLSELQTRQQAQSNDAVEKAETIGNSGASQDMMLLDIDSD